MSSEDKSSVSSENTAQTAEKFSPARRSFAKAGVIAPAILTLTSKSALGAVYQCTISGMQSGNASSHSVDTSSCGCGFSPGGWWQNASKPSNGSGACSTAGPDGNIVHWCNAKVNPFKIAYYKNGGTFLYLYDQYGTGTWTVPDTTKKEGQAWVTVCKQIYSTFKTVSSCDGGTVSKNGKTYKILKPTTLDNLGFPGLSGGVWLYLDSHHGTLEWHAIADYLNAALYQACTSMTNKAGLPFANVYSVVGPDDIIKIYNLAKNNVAFTSDSGLMISNQQDAINYLSMIHE